MYTRAAPNGAALIVYTNDYSQSKGKRSVGSSYFSHIFTTFFRVDATASLWVLGLLIIVIIVLLLSQEHTTFGMAPPGSGRW